jgi:shikimate dehydrogenase
MSADAIPYAEVIGDPIDHSLSPLIHNFWIEKLGIDADYRRHRVDRAGLATHLALRRADPAWRGCNVTMPLKLDAVRLADDSTDRAIGAGASNLLIPRDGKLLAGNTDVSAVMILVDRLAKTGAPMESVTLLGNGGAARAVLMALHLLGFHNVRIQSRDLAAAYKLAVEFGMKVEPAAFQTPVTSDGLINATPLGMTGQPPLNVDWRDMPASGWVVDVVSEPTALIAAAASRGLKVIDGIAMLVEQAAESFSFFFGRDPPRADDAELMERLRA